MEYRVPNGFLDMSNWESVATTPKHITPLIELVCAELDQESRPIYLTVNPSPEARIGRCYSNVTAAGLAPQHGWLLWELPGIFVCAEHHCVGVASDNTFKDVTPQMNRECRVLFLPDKCRTQDTPVPNRYWPSADHPLLHSYVRLKYEAERHLRAERLAEFKRVDDEITEIMRSYHRLLAKREKNAIRKEHRKDRKKRKRQH